MLKPILPRRLAPGLEMYINSGIMPGAFLSAVLKNNLRESFGQADEGSQKELGNLVCWLWNKAPAACWGSEENVTRWVELRRGKTDQIMEVKGND